MGVMLGSTFTLRPLEGSIAVLKQSCRHSGQQSPANPPSSPDLDGNRLPRLEAVALSNAAVGPAVVFTGVLLCFNCTITSPMPLLVFS